MRVQASDIVAFAALVLTVLVYMRARNKTLIWFLIIVGLSALSISTFSRSQRMASQTKQSATASGGSTINQAGRDLTIINAGIPESTVLKILSEKAISANSELAKKYPLGYVLMGIADGKVIFEPKSLVLQFDSDNKVEIEIDEVQQTAWVKFVFFKVWDTKRSAAFLLDKVFLETAYTENVSTPLPVALSFANTPYLYGYVEILDRANKVFVVGFSPDDTPPR
jgi:hypothetical protein